MPNFEFDELEMSYRGSDPDTYEWWFKENVVGTLPELTEGTSPTECWDLKQILDPPHVDNFSVKNKEFCFGREEAFVERESKCLWECNSAFDFCSFSSQCYEPTWESSLIPPATKSCPVCNNQIPCCDSINFQEHISRCFLNASQNHGNLSPKNLILLIKYVRSKAAVLDIDRRSGLLDGLKKLAAQNGSPDIATTELSTTINGTPLSASSADTNNLVMSLLYTQQTNTEVPQKDAKKKGSVLAKVVLVETIDKFGKVWRTPQATPAILLKSGTPPPSGRSLRPINSASIKVRPAALKVAKEAVAVQKKGTKASIEEIYAQNCTTPVTKKNTLAGISAVSRKVAAQVYAENLRHGDYQQHGKRALIRPMLGDTRKRRRQSMPSIVQALPFHQEHGMVCF